MKLTLKHILFAIPIVILAACSNTNPNPTDDLEIKGKLQNSNGEAIYLEKMLTNGLEPLDTAIINAEGEFTFSAAIENPGFYRISITDKNFATFIFEKDQQVSITGDATNLGNTYGVKGSPESSLFLEANHMSTKNFLQRDSLQKIFQTYANQHQGDTAAINSKGRELDVPFVKLINEHNAYLKKFIGENGSSLASLAVIQQLPIETNISTYVKLDKELFAAHPNSDYVIAFHNDIKAKTASAIGSEATEIKYNMPDGTALALSSLRGKVVLVDFWASWCRPCRAENPNLVRAYNHFKDKGFDIYSVSLDTNLDKWKAAIVKDNLTWNSHVCDFLGWKSPSVRDYNFNGIPYNVLLDKDGTIIAKNLRGAALDSKLAEVFK